MNPDEENNNPLNNPADEPVPTPEPEVTPEATPEAAPEVAPETTEPSQAPEAPEASETLEIPKAEPEPEAAPEATSEAAPESTPEAAPATETPTSSEPATTTPATISASQKKSSKLTIILVVVAAVLIIVGVVVAVMLMGKNGTSEGQNAAEEGAGTVLVCSASVEKSEKAETANEFTAYESEMSAYYDSEGNMTEIELSDEYTFADETAATNYAQDQETAYNKLLGERNISSDPFDSSFDVDETNVYISHFATLDLLNADNAAIFNLKVGEDGSVDTSSDTIKEIYASMLDVKYTCELSPLESADDEDYIDEEDEEEYDEEDEEYVEEEDLEEEEE